MQTCKLHRVCPIVPSNCIDLLVTNLVSYSKYGTQRIKYIEKLRKEDQ
jgi:hypothetical protein